MSPDGTARRLRSRMLRSIREFFYREGFIEADTPALSSSILPEPEIDVFAASPTLDCASGSSDRPLDAATSSDSRARYLLPSPERRLKRVVISGEPLVFQLAHSFRACEPDSPLHADEFTMLEWYAVDSDYHRELERTQRLISSLVPADSPFAPPPEILTVATACSRYAGVELSECDSIEDFRRRLDEAGIPYAADDEWADLFYRLMVGFVEPAIADLPALILTDYPYAAPCFAKRKAATPWRERWELYLSGVEIANCFSEETDPEALAVFIQQERYRMSAIGRAERIDTEFARLHRSAPERYAGVALGFDRLAMVLGGYSSIGEVAYLPD